MSQGTAVKTPRPRAPWSVAAIEILADGDWHHIDEFTVAMAPLIPQDKALATFDKHWLSGRPAPVSSRIQQGRRYILRHALGNLRKSGTIVQDGDRYRGNW